MWKVLVVLVLLAVGAAALWVNAGQAEGPAIEIGGPGGHRPDRRDRREGHGARRRAHGARRDARAGREHARRSSISRRKRRPSYDGPGDEVSVTRPAGKRVLPDLKAGEAQINVTAVRPVLFGLRQAAATATRTIEVRLTPPQLAVLSQFHYINHGGSEMVVYRVNPPDAESGVRVGDREYRGFPAGGADAGAARRVLRVAVGPELEHADHGVRARLRRQRRQRQLRLPRVPEAISREHDQSRRPIPRARRAADPAELDRAQGRRSEQLPGFVSRDQSRAAAHEQRDDREPRARARRRRSCGAGRSSNSSTRPSKRASPISARTSTTAPTSTGKCISASTWRRRPARPFARRTAAASCSPVGSGSTATA